MLMKIILRKMDAKEVVCDFIYGLNFVKSNDYSYNLLRVIEFAFGGKKDIYWKQHVDEQCEVLIIFASDGRLSYFKRLYPDRESVYECDDKFQGVKKYTISKYREIIFSMYIAVKPQLSIQRLWKCFIDGKDEKRRIIHAVLLKEYEPNILKLFGEYGPIKEAEINLDAAIDKKSTYDKAYEYGFFNVDSLNGDYVNKLRALKEKQLEFKNAITKYSLKNWVKKFEDMTIQEQKYLYLEKRRISIESQLKSLKIRREEGKCTFSNSFNSLRDIFPEADINRLNSIEKFHKRMADILSCEFDEKEKELEISLKEIKGEIDDIKLKCSMDKVSDEVLSGYDKNLLKIYKLEEMNSCSETKLEIQEEVNRLVEYLNKIKMDKFDEVQNAIQREIYNVINELDTYGLTQYSIEKIWDNNSLNDWDYYQILFDIVIQKMTGLPLLLYDIKDHYIFGKNDTRPLDEYLKVNRKQAFLIEE